MGSIQELLKVNPDERLGAGCFEWIPPPKEKKKTEDEPEDEKTEGDEEQDNGKEAKKPKALGKVIKHGQGYDIIRKHPFFAKHESSLLIQTNCTGDKKETPQPVPSEEDLAIRTTAHMIDESSLDVDLEDLHPPGDNSSYDALRLKPSDKLRVMHLLDRLHLLKEPRVYCRFFLTNRKLD